MNRMINLSRAIALAATIHEEQYDKCGVPYILHCLAVMEMVKEHGEDAMVVGVLHDTREDHTGNPKDKLKLDDDLLRLFGGRNFEALVALTHDPGEPYVDYIERVAGNYLARVVKIADLTHNMDPRRIPASQIVDKDFQRWDKYRKALIRLERS